jgi:hypothetical protein
LAWRQVRNSDTLHVLLPAQVRASSETQRQVKQEQRARAAEQQAREEVERYKEHQLREQRRENDDRSRQESARAVMLHRLAAARKELDDALKSRGSTPNSMTPRVPSATASAAQGGSAMSNSALLHSLANAEHAAQKREAAARRDALSAAAAAALLGLFVGDALGAAGDGVMNEQLMRDAHGVSLEIRPQQVRKIVGALDSGGVASLQEVLNRYTKPFH